MAVEQERKCGYRLVGGLYLCGSGRSVYCDRLPLELKACEVCGQEPRFNRTISRFNPQRLFSDHLCDEVDLVCKPPEEAYLMWVGAEYTPFNFKIEAHALGVSKRIHAIPTNLRLGKDIVYLAYLKLIPIDNQRFLFPLGPQDNKATAPGIFYGFIPDRYEYIMTETQAKDKEKMDLLKRRGIVVITVPDGDTDHNPKKKGEVINDPTVLQTDPSLPA